MGVGELADALKEANVPNYSSFEKGKTKAPLIGLFANAKSAKEQSWQIFVLDSDLDRARQVATAARFAARYPKPGRV
jgi:L-rhamnose mutarotase